MRLVDEFNEKVSRLRALLQSEALAGVLLKRQANFSWITCGGHNNVVTASDQASASVLVTPSRVVLVASNIEAERISAEEIRSLAGEIEVEAFPWSEKSEFEVTNAIMEGKKWGCDVSYRNARLVSSQVTEARTPLLELEVERYKQLGRDVAAVLKESAEAVEPGMTEFEAAGVMARGFLARGIAPSILLVAADDRIKKYRHPVPKKTKIKKRVMLVANVQRHGLYGSATRTVCFGDPPSTLLKRHEACCRIEAAAMAAAQPGTPLGRVFQAILGQYEVEGFGDEWRFHHQGGSIGYDGRDMKLTSTGLKTPVVENQAFAFNPSITGAKSEDTFLARPRGTDVITAPRGWPMIACETPAGTIKRPAMLVR